MKIMDIYKILKESPYTKAMSYFRVWCDDRADEYVKRKSSLFKYGKENKIPLNTLKEIAEDLEIPDISQSDWNSYEDSIS